MVRRRCDIMGWCWGVQVPFSLFSSSAAVLDMMENDVACNGGGGESNDGERSWLVVMNL